MLHFAKVMIQSFLKGRDHMATINDRLKDCRIQRNLTLLEVAEKIGVKEATMQRYESGAIKNIKHETVLAIADYYGVSPQYLMGWTDDPRPITITTARSESESILLDIFRNLNREGQALVIANAKMLSDMPEYKK
jgi:transcriptional regulator with XRE-family HTH domain